MVWQSSPPSEITAGTIFRTGRGGHSGIVVRLLGQGGQGAVYEVEMRGTRLALKWYHPSYAAIDTGLRQRLSRAIERGAPATAFLWPLDLADVPDYPSFGYIMRLREGGFAGMRDLIARPPTRIEPRLAVRATICRQISQSFLALHASGFCYQDINFGNVFFRPDDGTVLICDNDNVDVDGAPASVYGTRKFMAPEIVCRAAMPNTRTDLFSMAILFFYVLHAWHPLDGKREAAVTLMDAAAETSLYGTDPVFLFDPINDSNGPVAGMHEPVTARWMALPLALRALFVRSFTAGLRQPGARVQEAEWSQAFAAAAQAGFACNACGFEHTAEVSAIGVVGGPAQCLTCHKPLTLPPVLAIGRIAICLTHGTLVPLRLLTGDGRSYGPGDGTLPGGVVERHPVRPEIVGLRNAGSAPWRAALPNGQSVDVAPGSTIRLLDGMILYFGAATGRVLATAA